VRRRLGAWYRGALRDRLGPILPPVADLPATLQRVARTSHDLARYAEAELERVVRELVAEQEQSSVEEQA
jgi:predicted nucleic acid-binding OB-fold protein